MVPSSTRELHLGLGNNRGTCPLCPASSSCAQVPFAHPQTKSRTGRMCCGSKSFIKVLPQTHGQQTLMLETCPQQGILATTGQVHFGDTDSRPLATRGRLPSLAHVQGQWSRLTSRLNPSSAWPL